MGLFDGVFEFIDGLRKYNYTPSKSKPAPKKKAVTIELPDESAAWTGIVWHHSATKDNKHLENWSAIRKYHVETKGWRDIGYHGGVERVDGELQFQLGRSWVVQGAHSGFKGNQTYNRKYLGLCCVGNFDLEAPDRETWEYCLAVTRTIMSELDISSDEILGHREVYELVGKPVAKQCPGKFWDMDKFRSEL